MGHGEDGRRDATLRPQAAPVVTCPNCGHDVPDGTYCIRCGVRLHPEGTARPRGFSAAPDEGRSALRIVSTFFPQLPRADMDTFRLALGLGVATIVGLAVLGLYPLGLVAAAVLVPLLTVLYLYDVDVYEDEPLHVIGLTMLWGAVAGVVVGLVARAVSPTGAGLFGETSGATALWRGVALPVLGLVLVLAGPMFLLRYRRFNDVLDGATFGGATAVAYAGALAITQSVDLFGAGLRPPGEVLSWVARLIELGIAAPLLVAGTAGAVAGAMWLRHRAPGHDRAALGALGSPVVAFVVAAAALVAAALGQVYLPEFVSLVWLLLLAAAALVWLRRLIHIGLLQEAAELETGPEMTCPNCGATTLRHSFCSNCGVSLHALPKDRRGGAA